jgi:hypothetical protein
MQQIIGDVVTIRSKTYTLFSPVPNYSQPELQGVAVHPQSLDRYQKVAALFIEQLHHSQ